MLSGVCVQGNTNIVVQILLVYKKKCVKYKLQKLYMEFNLICLLNANKLGCLLCKLFMNNIVLGCLNMNTTMLEKQILTH